MNNTLAFYNEDQLRRESIAYLLLLVAGVVGAHRYYLGNWASAFIMTFLGVAAVYAFANEISGWEFLVFALVVWCLLDMVYVHRAVQKRRQQVYDLKPVLQLYR
ncbi:TM2 domain-containing protein [Marinobacterium weihaiense]|uniref:TM2 domain-containing protein n=1 Tax=Marinobacterium weihaiense TaxID=2851016 RepID=A0ABS6MEN2_9GAMM|nr:TM2 domain-containing protein [Marinobacterium weihaiense]MBV0934786.1 TM2 domain-containing protein [Marinobacterium weihaiense]